MLGNKAHQRTGKGITGDSRSLEREEHSTVGKREMFFLDKTRQRGLLGRAEKLINQRVEKDNTVNRPNFHTQKEVKKCGRGLENIGHQKHSALTPIINENTGKKAKENGREGVDNPEDGNGNAGVGAFKDADDDDEVEQADDEDGNELGQPELNEVDVF